MLTGKTALITGGSRGIGKAIAQKLSSLNCNVVINYNSNDKAASDLITELKSNGKEAFAIKGNVSDFNESKNIIDTTIKMYGSIDILVNNAGITRDNLILRMSEDDFDDVISTNLKGCFNCIKHTSKYMLKKKKGRIINIASVIGLIGNAGQSNYAASKAGIIGLTKSVAKELATRGITVNAIAPGFIVSDMTEKLTEEQKDVIKSNIPANALGTVEDVSNLVAFLASDESGYITGQVINVDGGMVV
ncbi:3-oxoacyl-[acyl-carrier-protein] reductase [Alkalibaculum sp. M08DMB]|uniref:3-oxoacyl-[acyl-carrier-protein] reductase n=1 Tax=Alkalibaculum sporogenes TaxID=2655001 RepID=A0A6A7KB17_9FIRM|nr:3-oxoacyl-[acyl-carrier-protein] reductase [Alkalibaculum sporogenes]MPW26387.1 3-oxoacyl-[acyl-carrier-protein] reductase [Alkalibaculum sporogenes]